MTSAILLSAVIQRRHEPLLPNKPRDVPRVDDRCVLNGIFWVLRSSAPWRDLPERYGPRATCYSRFVRWRKADVWDRLMDVAHDGQIADMLLDQLALDLANKAITENPKSAEGYAQKGSASPLGAELKIEHSADSLGLYRLMAKLSKIVELRVSSQALGRL